MLALPPQKSEDELVGRDENDSDVCSRWRQQSPGLALWLQLRDLGLRPGGVTALSLHNICCMKWDDFPWGCQRHAQCVRGMNRTRNPRIG